MNEWVVTIKVERQGPVGITVLITEFYRGEREECLRIRNHFSPGSSDLHDSRNTTWNIITGPAEEWDEFVR